MAENSLAIIRSSQLAPFICHLKAHGRDPAVVLRKCWCPVSVDFEDPDSVLPAKRLWQFVEETARVMQSQDTSWNVAMEYGLQGSRYFGYLLENQASLRDALDLNVKLLAEHANSGTLKLEISGNNLQVIRGNHSHRFSSFFQAEQYAVGVFVHTIRNYLGPKWQPMRISITSTPDQPENCAMAKCCGELETGAEQCVITVPIDQLDEERKGLPNSIKTQGLPPCTIQPDNHRALKQLLFSYLPDYPLTRKTVSYILMLHPKTLYRQLEWDGISYSAIRNEVILETAKAELATGELPIGEIAKLLGYSHQSAFARAFQKLVGLSPQDFRISAKTAQ